MQVVVNHPLIKKRGRNGQLAFLAGLVAAGIGVVLTLRIPAPNQQLDSQMFALSYGMLVLGIIAFVVARYNTARWVRRPRADEVLGESLRGLDSRYYLLSYLPGVPVEHLLITPQGLVVIVAKHLLGQFRNRRGRWQRKFDWGLLLGTYAEGSLGNPTQQALRGVEAVKARLAEALGEAESVPVSTVVVFTQPQTRVEVEDPVVPVVAPDDLLDHIRALNPKTKLSPQRVDELADLFAPDRKAYKESAKKAEKPAPKKAKKRARAHAKTPATDMSKLGRNRAERRMR